jgi:hypothetical protein
VAELVDARGLGPRGHKPWGFESLRPHCEVRQQLTWADRLTIVGVYAAGIVGAALFPRLARWARWPTRLGLRGRIAYAGFNALMMFAILQFVGPHVRRIVEEQERAG